MDKEIDNLYKAVDAYVKARGGEIIVIGGVTVIDSPKSLRHNWTLGIKCTGSRPEYARDRKEVSVAANDES